MNSAGKNAGKTRCLIVDDDERLRAVLVEALSARGFAVSEAASVAAARAVLGDGTPDLVILDVALPDGRASDVLDLLGYLSPAPRVVALSGAAGPDESFALAQRGVRIYLKKPIQLDELEQAVERALSQPPDLVPHVRAAVGLKSIHEVEQTVRETMVQEAIARGQGNRRVAARVLGISRQLLQHILRKL